MKPSSSYSALSAAAFFLACSRLAVAVPWLEPMATPVGEWAGNMGFSPMPTRAPGRIPKELLRRQDVLPDNWCGFITGDVNDVLSCRPAYTCVYSGTAVGCCGAGLIATCTALFTSCVNYNDNCGSACNANNRILKCSGNSAPYCATYTFSSGKVNYNCATQKGILSNVEFLSDVLATASASASPKGGPLTIPSAAFSFTVGGDSSSSTTISGSVVAATTTTPAAPASKSGVGAGVIAGIVVGAIAIIGAVAGGLLAFFCLRGRNKGNNGAAAAAAAAATEQPPMQQQPPPPNQYQPDSQGQYAPVPQSYPPPQPQSPYYQQQQAGTASSFYDAKLAGTPTDVPPQYQPNSPQPPHQDYAAYNPAAAAAQRDSIMKAPVVPEISGTPVPGQQQQQQQGPSRVTSPVSVVGTGTGQGYEVGSTSGPVYEMAEGAHR